jgi:hypothetical protein
MTRDEDAARMLAEIQAAHTELARRARAPRWYYPLLGLLAGGYIAVQAAPSAARLVYLAVFLVAIGLMIPAYRRKTGLWINGWRAGRTRWVSAAWLALFLGGLVAAMLLEERQGVHGAYLVVGAATAIVTTAYGFVWEAAFRRDLRDGTDL